MWGGWGAGFNAKTLYRYWASNYLTGKDYNPVKQDNVSGGYFLRVAGKKVQLVGSFRYFGDHIVNRGKSYSVNTNESTLTGKTYEFLVQKLSLNSTYTQSTKILGRNLIFVIQPDNNSLLNINSESYFLITKNISLTV